MKNSQYKFALLLIALSSITFAVRTTSAAREVSDRRQNAANSRLTLEIKDEHDRARSALERTSAAMDLNRPLTAAEHLKSARKNLRDASVGLTQLWNDSAKHTVSDSTKARSADTNAKKDHATLTENHGLIEYEISQWAMALDAIPED